MSDEISNNVFVLLLNFYSINNETGETKVWNDGLGIPIEMNEENNLYNPELIFGHLLTSSNYDDKEDRMTSGRNGLGIKLTNVFSSWFKVNIVDASTTKQNYIKEWSVNMRDSKPEKIKKKHIAPHVADNVIHYWGHKYFYFFNHCNFFVFLTGWR